MDIIRIIAMFYVMVFHIVGQGGLLSLSHEAGEVTYRFIWYLDTWTYCCVDIFALITGYVYYSDEKRSHRFSNLFNLWLQVFFYSISIAVFYKIRHPELISFGDLTKMFFPVSNNLYWYFTAFVGTFFLIPFITEAIRQMTESFCRKSFVMLFLLFCFYENFVGRFSMDNGYNFPWVTFLCLLGALAKKGKLFAYMQISVAVLLIIAVNTFSWFYAFHGPSFTLFGRLNEPTTFIRYTAPTVVFVALMHLAIGEKLIVSDKIGAFTKSLSHNIFAAYIINTHPYLWTYSLKNRSAGWIHDNLPIILAKVIGFSVAFLIGSILIDRVRVAIFRLLHIPDLTGYLERKINQFLNFVCNRSLERAN